MDPKAAGRRKGGNQKDTGLRAYNKARKSKILPNKKKEQGLSKERVFLYKPFIPMPDLSEYVNQNIEVKIYLIEAIFRSESLWTTSALTTQPSLNVLFGEMSLTPVTLMQFAS